MLRQLHYELLRGLAYRAIRHANIRAYTTWLPLSIWIVLVGVYLLLPQKPVLSGKDGAAATALSVLSTLPGFYFAGLAAVATFGSAAMDQQMPDPAPELEIRVGGRSMEAKLTRRQFLSYLFSYLVVVSLVLCFSLIFIYLLTPTLGSIYHNLLELDYGDKIWFAGKLITVAGVGALFSSMLVTTLHGVYFLTEKVHQP